MKAQNLVLLLPLAVLVACGRAEAPPPPPAAPAAAVVEAAPATAATVLAGASGSSVAGALQLVASNDGVTLTGELSGLAPNTEHGFHVHEIGDCSAPDAKSAGDHFNPDHAEHGGPTSAAKHLGDIPNITSDATGQAAVNATIARATLRDGGPNDLAGRAVIVHAKRDDYATQPSGDSGDRIACGVVR
ncbi:MAG: superoxide dismutase family protein [Steroidobacteraceae bacterium]